MEHPKRVIHLIRTLDPGGCEHMLLSLLPALKSRDWDITIVTLGNEGILASRFRERNITVISRLFHFPLDPLGLFRLAKTIRDIRPELIVSHLLHADMITRLFRGSLFGIPTIPVIHSTYNSSGLFMAQLFERFTARTLKHCIVVSPAVADAAKARGLVQEAIHLIPNPVDTDMFHPVPHQKKEEMRKDLNILPGTLVLICVANFLAYKKHEDLLDAFAPFSCDFPQAVLLLVGQGPEEEKIRAIVKRRGLGASVRFLGRRTDVAALLQSSDIFVLPSLFEGMSVALMEAMSSALPVVASDIPENQLLIKHQKNGLLTPREDPQSLQAVLTSLAHNETMRTALGKEARETMKTTYGLSSICTHWEKLYEDIVLSETL